MIQKHVLYRNDQIRFIKKLDGNFTYHALRAMDEYIERQKNTNATTSPKSMRILKGGEEVSI